MSFGAKLNSALTLKQISQKDLALMIGKTKSSVSQYISGKQLPSEKTLYTILDVLDLEIDYFNEESEEDEDEGIYIKNVPVKVAAKRLGVSDEFVRQGLRDKRLPIGSGVKIREKWKFYISPVALERYIKGEIWQEY